MILKNFIVFEGIDGAGTSTQINLLKQRKEAGNFFFTAEPTGSQTGKFLRAMLKGSLELDSRTSAYLFAADRAEHLWGADEEHCGIAKKCSEGKIVVSDRYLFSSLTYQSVTCGEELPRLLNSPFPLPQLLFFFEISPELSLKRVDGRGEREIYEKIEFLKAAEERYEKLMDEYEAKNTGMKIIRLKAEKTKEELAEEIWKEISTEVLQ